MSDYAIEYFYGSQRQWPRMVTYRFHSRVSVNCKALAEEIRRRVPRVELLLIEPYDPCRKHSAHHYKVMFATSETELSLEHDSDVMSEIGNIVRALNETRRKLELYETLTETE